MTAPYVLVGEHATLVLDDDAELAPQPQLRRRHERAIFRAIASEAAASRTELVEVTGLSIQSVGRIVAELLERRLVEETALIRTKQMGASRIQLQLRADGAFAVGFALERDQMTGVLLNLAGRVLWQVSLPLERGASAEGTLDNLRDAIDRALESSEWSPLRARIIGIGLVTPGPIDLLAGAVVGVPNFPQWAYVDLAVLLKNAFSLPVVYDNSATAGAIGVDWQRNRQDAPFLFCYWGVGIGGGLVTGDDVYRGTTGNAIEIGHTSTDPSGRLCGCGNRGCLETEASLPALLRDAAEYGDFSSIEELVMAAANRPELDALLRAAAIKMANAIVNAVNILDVGEVVLGGSHFPAVEPIFMPVIQDYLQHRSFRRNVAPTRVRASALGDAANAIGAACLVFHSLLPQAARRTRSSASPATVRRRPTSLYAPAVMR